MWELESNFSWTCQTFITEKGQMPTKHSVKLSLCLVDNLGEILHKQDVFHNILNLIIRVKGSLPGFQLTNTRTNNWDRLTYKHRRELMHTHIQQKKREKRHTHNIYNLIQRELSLNWQKKDKSLSTMFMKKKPSETHTYTHSHTNKNFFYDLSFWSSTKFAQNHSIYMCIIYKIEITIIILWHLGMDSK